MSEAESVAPELEPAPEPEPVARQASAGNGGCLVMALLAIALFALPILLLMELISAGPLMLITAEALEHTDGLDRELFGAAWRLAWVVNLVTLAWCVVRRIATRGDPHRQPWRPLAYLWLAYLVGIWATVPADAYDAVDVPDGLTTFLLVGADGLAGLMIPLLLLLLLGRLLVILWQRARASAASYHRVVGMASAMSIGGASIVGATALYESPGAGGQADSALAEAIDELSLDLDVEDLQRSTYQTYVSASSAIGAERETVHAEAPPTPAPAPSPLGIHAEPEDAFAECADRLASSVDGERAVMAQAIDHLERQWYIDRAQAEDLAMDALIKTCRSYAGNPRSWIVQTYWTAIRNESINWKARRDTQRRYAGDAGDLLRDWAQKPDPLETLLDKQKVEAGRAAYWSLSDADRRIVDLRLDGHAYAEIARRTGVDPATARKRYQRALDKMKRSARRQGRGLFDD